MVDGEVSLGRSPSAGKCLLPCQRECAALFLQRSVQSPVEINPPSSDLDPRPTKPKLMSRLCIDTSPSVIGIILPALKCFASGCDSSTLFQVQGESVISLTARRCFPSELMIRSTRSTTLPGGICNKPPGAGSRRSNSAFIKSL
jgi:hypothetical protein